MKTTERLTWFVAMVIVSYGTFVAGHWHQKSLIYDALKTKIETTLGE